MRNATSFVDIKDNAITRMENRAKADKIYMNSNKVFVSGIIENDLEYSHTVIFEKFYRGKIRIKRRSGTEDIIPIVISGLLLELGMYKTSLKNKWVELAGQFRTYNVMGNDGKSHLKMDLFVTEIEVFENEDELKERPNSNLIYLDGYLCKPTLYRKTPEGKDITNFLIAANRNYGRSDYIPCIVWGRVARWAKILNIGDRVQIYGRIQSRPYKKKISPDPKNWENKIAYEVSVMEMELIEE